MTNDKCNWKHCRNVSDLGYLGKGICSEHWSKFCEMQEQGKENQARKKIGLGPRPESKVKPQTETEVEEDEEETSNTEDNAAPVFRKRRR